MLNTVLKSTVHMVYFYVVCIGINVKVVSSAPDCCRLYHRSLKALISCGPSYFF